MSKALNLIGKRYGKLLILKRLENNKRGNTIWLCKCDCGKETEVEGYLLTSGHTQSCGCLSGYNFRGKTSMRFNNLQNNIYDDYKVVSLKEIKNGVSIWMCKCTKCGKEKQIRAGNINSHKGTTCDCTKKEMFVKSKIGQRFGRLEIKSFLEERGKSNYIFKCRCDCGKEVDVPYKYLKDGHKKSCGCLSIEAKKIPKRTTHGDTNKRIYKEYRSMINRCSQKYHDSKNYHDRGISICDEWIGDCGYNNFKDWSIKNGYQDDLSLDRIDVNGNYSPSNCRWITMKKQQNNRRNNIYIEYENEVMTLKEWSEKLNLNYGMLKQRYRRGEVPPILFRPKKIITN